jgi:hypothetical protein
MKKILITSPHYPPSNLAGYLRAYGDSSFLLCQPHMSSLQLGKELNCENEEKILISSEKNINYNLFIMPAVISIKIFAMHIICFLLNTFNK